MAEDLMMVPSESDALAEFAREHGRQLVRLAFVLTGDSEESQDLVQSVLLKLHSKDLSRISNPLAYARRAVTNEFLTARRRRLRMAVLLNRFQVEPELAEPGDIHAERDALLRALRPLSPKQRAAIVLRYFEDYSDQDIAELLACSPATVRSLISRAIPRLREQLTEGSVE